MWCLFNVGFSTSFHLSPSKVLPDPWGSRHIVWGWRGTCSERPQKNVRWMKGAKHPAYFGKYGKFGKYGMAPSSWGSLLLENCCVATFPGTPQPTLSPLKVMDSEVFSWKLISWLFLFLTIKDHHYSNLRHSHIVATQSLKYKTEHSLRMLHSGN